MARRFLKLSTQYEEVGNRYIRYTTLQIVNRPNNNNLESSSRMKRSKSLVHAAMSVVPQLSAASAASAAVHESNRKFSLSHLSNNCAEYATDNLDTLLRRDDKANQGVDVVSVFQSAMKKVPQAVIIVTTAKQNKDGSWIKRGITCSSFTPVSFNPPILSFCVKKPSRMHNLLQETDRFAVHVLAQDQIRHSLHFAKSYNGNACPFDNIPHVQGDQGLPIIMGSVAVLLCETHSVHTVGDHHVYYGRLQQASMSSNLQEPLLYFVRSFRSVGDHVFIQAFEGCTLPFEDWTHEAHIRMAWNYIKQYGKDKATPYIKLGIQKFNEKNADKIKTGYHETVTMFFIHLVTDAINKVDDNVGFDKFLCQNQQLLDNSLILQYYSKTTLSNPESKDRFISPDIKPLPCS